MSEEAAVQPSPPSAPAAAPAMVELVATASMLLYLAEHEENPGIASYWDAFHYISSAVVSAYAGVHPVTPLGKMIAGIVMMVAPTLKTS